MEKKDNNGLMNKYFPCEIFKNSFLFCCIDLSRDGGLAWNDSRFGSFLIDNKMR